LAEAACRAARQEPPPLDARAPVASCPVLRERLGAMPLALQAERQAVRVESVLELVPAPRASRRQAP
jgi:hypothetical protein